MRAAAPLPTQRHRRTRARAEGACGAPAERIAARARRAHGACAPRAADNDDINDKAALAAIESILSANKARPPASLRRAFASGRDPTPRSAALLGPLPSMHRRHANAYPLSACHDLRLLQWRK